MTKIEQVRLHGALPTPKGVALAIMELCGRDDATIEQIARVVQTDPVTAARLLRMANSAPSAARPVAGLPDAILRLGLAAVRQLAMGFALVDQYRDGPCKAFDYPHFWSHSLLMAVAMHELGSVTRAAPPDELFACGLLARIGRLALASIYPNEYGELLQRASGNLVELEQQVLQTNHNEFTLAIMADCGIPHALAEPVFFHEAPDASQFKDGSRPHQLTHLFYHARRLADLTLADEAQRSASVTELLLLGGKIGLNADELGALIDRSVLRWRELSELLHLKSELLPPFAEMLNRPLGTSGGDTVTRTPRVLLLGDTVNRTLWQQDGLRVLLGNDVHAATNDREALAIALEVMPRIVILDRSLAAVAGVDFCRALRATEWGRSMYVIMLLDDVAEHALDESFAAGMDDYLTAPVSAGALQARMRAAQHHVLLLESWEQDRAQLKQFSAELAISNRKLERHALTDLLTGLQNRRAGMNTLLEAWGASNRSGESVSVMMIDIDEFKRVNDTYGHAVGDRVLVEMAAVMRQCARREDSVCRMGGEEFLILCRNTNLEGAVSAAERLRQKVRSLRVQAAGAEIQATISIGIACKEADMGEHDAVINAADKALYAAKHAGRDRIFVYAAGEVDQPADRSA